MSTTSLPFNLEAMAEPAELVARRLARALDYAEGFWLGFVKCNLLVQRRKAAAACGDLLEPLGIRLIEVRLTEPIRELLPGLKDRIAREQRTIDEVSRRSFPLQGARADNKLAVSIYGLEYSIPSSESYAPILSYLNLNRELFRQEIPYPLVFWLPDYALTALARRAPDFWAWRSGFYEVAAESDLAEGVFQLIQEEERDVTTSLSERARLERLAMLKGLLDDYREMGDGPHEREAQGEILRKLGLVYNASGELAMAQQALEEALGIARDLRDSNRIEIALHDLGRLAQVAGDYAKATRLYDESLRSKRESGNQLGLAITLHNLGKLAQDTGDYQQARRLYEESLAISRKIGNESGVSITLNGLGRLAESAHDYGEARGHYEQSLAINRKLGDKSGIATTLHNLGKLALDVGDYEQARRLYEESLAINRELGKTSGIATTLHNLARLAHDIGDHTKAQNLYEESLRMAETRGDRKGAAATLYQLGKLAQDRGEYAEARGQYEKSLSLARQPGNKLGEALSLAQLALLDEQEGKYEQGVRHAKQAEEILLKSKNQRYLARVTEQRERLEHKAARL